MNYLITGDDEYIKLAEEKKIREKFLSPLEDGLNYSVHGPENLENLMDSLTTMPFLSEKRVVLVREIQDLPERFFDTVLSYLKNPSKTSVLVLSSDASFKKNKHYHSLSGLVKVIKADKPDAATAKLWIKTFFDKQEVKITPAAVDLIIELKGDDTTGIKMELDKLAAFSGRAEITEEHVRQLVGRSVTESVFKLVDAVNKRDAKWAFRVLDDLYDQKKQPQEIIGYLCWYLRMMQKAGLLKSGGVSETDIPAQLGHKPFYGRRLVRESGKYPAERIRQWLSLLLEADRDIKTGRREGRVAVEMLVTSLM